MTWFDGLPVEVAGEFDGCDAAALAARWTQLDGSLEGQFNAVQLDLQEERAELLLDTLGLVEVFAAQCDGGTLVSNSATLIAELLDLRSPDPLGISSFMGLGWAAGDRTLTREVRVLCGGARHSLRNGTLHSTRGFGPHSIPRTAHKRLDARELAAGLTGLTARATHDMDRVSCAITAGHDTRVLVGLLRAAGGEACYYTDGRPGDLDVVIAAEIAARLGLAHEVVSHELDGSQLDWTEAAAHFIVQNDGLSSLLQIPNYIDLGGPQPPLGVKLWGVGGEIGRAGTGGLISIATGTPLVRSSIAMQRRLLGMKARDGAGLMTADACAELTRYMDGFVAERLQEGWRSAELQEAFFIFERLGRWGATGPRRAAGTDDLFSPFCSRLFIDYCFSLSPGERYIGASHHRILSELSPTLRDHRYDIPSLPQRAWLAPALATGELLRLLRDRIAPAGRPDSSDAEAGGALPAYEFQHEWFEARLDLLRELFATPSSDLWDFVSRPHVQALMEGDEAGRSRHQEMLLRAATLFWRFHGPAPARSSSTAITPPLVGQGPT